MNQEAILAVAAQATKTMLGYKSRDELALFGHDLIDLWNEGRIEDEDFRERLCSLAVAPVGD